MPTSPNSIWIAGESLGYSAYASNIAYLLLSRAHCSSIEYQVLKIGAHFVNKKYIVYK
jgi:hypothetical protein